MTYSFNLVDEPWIPCLTFDGERVELGLRDTLAQAHELREVRGDTPLETASLYRLLLVMLHRVVDGPRKRSAWIKLWRKRQEGFDPAKVDGYLQRWYHRFNLFDPEYPFFQVADESQLGKRATVNKMIPQLTPDATLFEHTLNDEKQGASLTTAEAARALIVNQNYGLGYQLFVDAPCAKGTVFIIQGITLIETLLLNLVRYPAESGEYISTSDDAPAWERNSAFEVVVEGVQFSRDAVEQIRNGKRRLSYERHVPRGQLDYMTWHNRKIKLFPEGLGDSIVVRSIAWAPGMRLDDQVTDPMQHYTRGKDGWQVYSLKPERSLWRDLDSLLRFFQPGSKALGVSSIAWVATLTRKDPQLVAKMYLLSAFGMVKDKAKLLYLRRETTPLPIDVLRDKTLLGQLARALQIADRSSVAIRRAAFVLAWLILSPDIEVKAVSRDQIDAKIARGRNTRGKDEEAKRIYKFYQSWGVERYYWSDLEVHFHRLIQDLADAPEQSLQIWQNQVRRAATSAFNQVESYAGGDQRAMRATAVARQWFYIELAAVLGKANNKSHTKGGDES
ncbi:MAG: type I-E CRISPR-associated protein Cse1/CasA [Chloroflexi bacterium]|nr:MAG: type I-E CRISPR-associated protein Cse1/CasA [Chloroflexota bacterium]RLC87367.1 MAG: type I-E CRISPR-associated protein Cse1/CasA [Chloroflexota bacterium]